MSANLAPLAATRNQLLLAGKPAGNHSGRAHRRYIGSQLNIGCHTQFKSLFLMLV